MESDAFATDLIKSKKMADKSAPNPTQSNPSFDCNICLDLVSDPVVTLCGHLYCWPCIYRWLHPNSSKSIRSCPVCKSPLTDSSLIPLYGRGDGIDIPGRPRGDWNLAAAEKQPYRTRLHSTAGIVLGEIACAVGSRLSPAMGDAIVENPRWRRLETRSEILLHQLWVFLLCCALFCLFFF